MSLCPINGAQCNCQPQDNVWCQFAKTDADHCKVWRSLANVPAEAWTVTNLAARLSEVLELEKRATAGPWKSEHDSDMKDTDADFIIALRNLIHEHGAELLRIVREPEPVNLFYRSSDRERE